MSNLDFSFMSECAEKLLSAVPVTLLMVGISLLLSIVIGFIVAITRILKVPIIAKLFSGLVTFIRGIPIMVQLYISFFAIPLLIQQITNSEKVININPLVFAISALTINYIAIFSEVIRPAILSIDHGQYEASYSIGENRFLTMKRVILPQAFVVALPNFQNSTAQLIKDSSLSYMVMVMDITGKAKSLGSENLNYFEAYLVAGLFYWAINLTVEVIYKKLEVDFGKFMKQKNTIS
ncbi:MAG: amino acid ABC transporter permease [Streptococcaceae bacterium]|jgi:His/Glu/Gln/Arg/opine family amino acid ABC transporter permease subunit|nr:amino acid ABC transporter permease [Streptococcaceae bacterium]MCH4176354.1 amino acid ABC transporter permease [Streptococcaceae bacterium]